MPLIPLKSDQKLCTSKEIITTVPKYVSHSDHSIIESYVLGRNYKPIRGPRPTFDPNDKLRNIESISTKHAYGVTFPLRYCDFIGIDIDAISQGENGPRSIKTIVHHLADINIIESIDVYMSSYYVFDEDSINTILNCNDTKKINIISPNLHVYCKLSKAYDPISIYSTEIVKDVMCLGYFMNALSCSVMTLRISNTFNSVDKINKQLRFANLFGGGSIYSQKRCSMPVNILSGVRGKRGMEYVDYSDNVFSNLTQDKISTITNNELKIKQTNINRNILTRLR